MTEPLTWKGRLANWFRRITGGLLCLELAGDFSLFRVLTLRLRRGNPFESLRLPMVARTYGLLLVSLLTLYLLAPQSPSTILFSVSVQVTHQIAFFVILTFFVSYLIAAFHEMGHYVVYKSLGGQSNEIGFGLKFMVMPTLYVNTDTVHLWKQRWKRMLVSFGGSIVDLTLGLLVAVLIRYQGAAFPNAAFFGYMILISVLIKLTFNLNFFVPGTDGYFIMSDLLKLNNLQKSVQTAKNQFLTAVGRRDLRAATAIGSKNWHYLTYFSVGFVFKCVAIALTIYSFIYLGTLVASL